VAEPRQLRPIAGKPVRRDLLRRFRRREAAERAVAESRGFESARGSVHTEVQRRDEVAEATILRTVHADD